MTRTHSGNLSRWVVKKAIAFIAHRKEVYFTFETAHDRDLWIRDGLINDRNSLVINGAGVDPTKFFPRTSKKTGQPLSILFASRLLKSKGLEAFLRAAEKFLDNCDIRFVVAGMVEPNDPDAYSPDQLATDKRIAFLGEVSDMPGLLRNTDIVCLPTLYGEGIPRILIEAAASGVPAIATDVPGCREIVLNDVTGITIEIGSPGSMADDIAAAVRRYRADASILERHGDAAYAYFKVGNFSQDTITRCFADLLQTETPSIPGGTPPRG
jgi:glycosyltransferase involved in cell wall biosynthesis